MVASQPELQDIERILICMDLYRGLCAAD